MTYALPQAIQNTTNVISVKIHTQSVIHELKEDEKIQMLHQGLENFIVKKKFSIKFTKIPFISLETIMKSGKPKQMTGIRMHLAACSVFRGKVSIQEV